MTQQTLQNVVLEVISENSLGTRTWIGPHQDLTIGGNEMAEFVLPYDSYLSGVHFRLSSNDRGCRLFTHPSAETYVNGQAVKTTSLHDGDTIRCGQTELIVRIRGGASRESAAASASQPASSLQAATPVPVQKPAAKRAGDDLVGNVMAQLGLV